MKPTWDERLAALADAGAELGAIPARERIERLGSWIERIRAPGSELRAGLERELPAATGFAAATVERGLELALAAWSPDTWRTSFEHDAPGEPLAYAWCATLLAGAIPMPTLLALAAPLGVGMPVALKRATADAVTAPLAVADLAAHDPVLGRAALAVEASSQERGALDALCRAPCVVAYGSDESVAAVAGRLTEGQHFVAHGHRVSIAFVGAEAGREEAAGLASDLALDVALWDQLGCLSPAAVFVEGGPRDAAHFAERLAASLFETGTRLPRGAVSASTLALASHERAEAELRAAAGRAVVVHDDPAHGTVIAEDTPEWRAGPLHRFVRVHPIASAGELERALDPLRPWLAAVGVGGLAEPARQALAVRLRALGASRVCPLGTMQAPPLDWPHDGQGPFRPLLRKTS